ncbi:MAG: SpoIID/LytB domain-containing protein [Gemmatimonadaceae bacterium]
MPVHRAAAIALAGAVACASALPRGGDQPGSDPDAVSAADRSDQPVRVALAIAARSPKIGGTGSWAIYNRNSANLVTRGTAGTTMRVERRNGQLVAIREDGSVTSRFTGPLIVRAATPGTFLTHEGKRYRGEFVITPSADAILVVNRLGVESYLRGVVPLEIGNRIAGEEAAVEAQAVAARSYSYIKMAEAGSRAFDMYSSVQDQVYGGADAEKPMADAAVATTANMVLRYGGRIVNTPYSSTCGGSTAAVQEVWWRESPKPHLQPVSDRVPGSDKFYCDASPRFRWTSTFEKSELKETLEKYLGQYTRGAEPSVAPNPTAPRVSVGTVRSSRVEGRTASDRVSTLSVQTSGGNYALRGNDIRFVLRTPTGTILNSTYFTAETTIDGSGEVSRLTLRGGGYGHGIGMCQWGAIGRARAGQDYRTILTTYYPGTTVGSVN